MKAHALVHDVYVECDMNAIHDILLVITTRLDGRASLACLCVAMPLPELMGNKSGGPMLDQAPNLLLREAHSG
jgi:hypothetical protein